MTCYCTKNVNRLNRRPLDPRSPKTILEEVRVHLGFYTRKGEKGDKALEI